MKYMVNIAVYNHRVSKS